MIIVANITRANKEVIMNYSQAIKKATKHATAMKKLAKIASIML